MPRPRPLYHKQIHVGDNFGKLTVSGDGFIRGSLWAFPCRCECGNETVKSARALALNLTDSCGCLGRIRHLRALEAKTARWLYPGATFGRLTCIRRVVLNGRPTKLVVCECECGTIRKFDISGLRNGATVSCGCIRTEKLIATNREFAAHGGMMADPQKLPVYRTWVNIKRRCYDPRHKSFAGYGDSGIVMCNWLRESPLHLLQLLGTKPSKDHSIDRHPIHDGHYTCGRCDDCREHGYSLNLRWATASEQQRNKGDQNRWLEAFGERRLLCDWSRLSGITASCLHIRIKRGWTSERSLTTPDRSGNCYRPPTET